MKSHVAVLCLVANVLAGATLADVLGYSMVVSELGRMEITDETEAPTDSLIPEDRLREYVGFHLYTVANPDEMEVIYVGDDDALASSRFDAAKPTRFFIHGWQSSVEGPASVYVREAYIAGGDYNVIIVDWSAFAGSDYLTARMNLLAVGTYVGKMIDYLETRGMKLDDLIVSGHSLGGHMAGVASRTATNTVASVIALDPAGPLFYFTGIEARLKSTDADYVQVIHTNTAILGYNQQLGDVDFWPNGGAWQAGCDWDFFGLCSHQRAYIFFAESIVADENAFLAHNCESYSNYAASRCTSNSAAYMGGSILDTDASGNYYLTTNSQSPYAVV